MFQIRLFFLERIVLNSCTWSLKLLYYQKEELHKIQIVYNQIAININIFLCPTSIEKSNQSFFAKCKRKLSCFEEKIISRIFQKNIEYFYLYL